MPVTQAKSAPYAPAKAILELVNRHRARGLPSPVDGEVLSRAGISDSLNTRTLQALQTLDLVDDEGRHTEILEGLRLAPEEDFPKKMAEWLNSAYADVLQFVDPATDDDVKVRDAFRLYKPTGQQDRMVTLFVGLYTAAGVRPEKTKTEGRPSRPRTTNRRPRKQPAGADTPPPPGNRHTGGIPAPISGLLSSLPAEGTPWTKDRRDSFVATFNAVLDYCFPITEASEPEKEHAATQDD